MPPVELLIELIIGEPPCFAPEKTLAGPFVGAADAPGISIPHQFAYLLKYRTKFSRSLYRFRIDFVTPRQLDSCCFGFFLVQFRREDRQ